MRPPITKDTALSEQASTEMSWKKNTRDRNMHARGYEQSYRLSKILKHLNARSVSGKVTSISSRNLENTSFSTELSDLLPTGTIPA